MKVYHSSACIVDHPDIYHSRNNLDFGRGFYVTTMKDQAVSYAQRFIRRGKSAFLNTYDFDEIALAGFGVLVFDAYDDHWLDFVMECRKGGTGGLWDVVMGGIANDRVFTTVDLFSAGEISRQEALGRLAYVKPNNQICLRTQGALEGLLIFCDAEEISYD